MRSFIALNFSDEVKSQIKEIITKVKTNSTQGKFVNKEHMHLTIEFLGEIQSDRVNEIKEIMNDLKFEAITLRLTKIGYFKSREGNIYWLGIEKNDTLLLIQATLHQRLRDKGFEIEDRVYKPHVTIGRKVKLKESFDLNEITNSVENIEIDINSVDLMKSEFIGGKLIHSIVYSRR